MAEHGEHDPIAAIRCACDIHLHHGFCGDLCPCIDGVQVRPFKHFAVVAYKVRLEDPDA